MNDKTKIVRLDNHRHAAAPQAVSLEDFHSYMPMHTYIFAPTREMWPASSVNPRIGAVPLFDLNGKPELDKNGDQVTLSASKWLDANAPVEQMTWAPGEPMLITDRLISEGGWIERPGAKVFNLYRPPGIIAKPGPVDRWLDHGFRLFGQDFEHIAQWLAHRVQRPQEKINHALVLGGAQGIGKDSEIEPVKHAVGPWNFVEISPQQMLGRFNGFLRSVILRISEARDLGDVDRFAFYDHMKAYTAAPPDVLRVDEKNLREYAVPNCVGVIITSNHKADGMFLPADDRRHFVAWSDLKQSDFSDSYFRDYWSWLNTGGNAHVAHYLQQLDLRGFDPKAPPPKTSAFWEIVDASRAPEDAELADALDALGKPAALTLDQIANCAGRSFAEWLRDRKNARRIPHRLEACGYVAVRNEGAKDGLFKIAGRRQVIYAKAELSIRERIAAAMELSR